MPRLKHLGTLLMPNQATDLLLPAHCALSCLTNGAFQDTHRQDLAVLANVAQVMAEDEGEKARPVLLAGMALNRTLLALMRRHGDMGRWGATGPELTALRSALTTLDAYLRRQTTLRIKAAVRRVDALMDAMTEYPLSA